MRLDGLKPLILAFTAPLLAQPPLADLKKEALAETGKRAKLVQEMVDSIFSFAELGFQEFETSRYLTGILEKNGFRIERGISGIPTAWIATFTQGSGKPVIGMITDIDCIPKASQKPGVAYHDPLIEGAPGHGEGHNSGMAVTVVSAIVVKELMQKYRIPGALKLYPGVAEEQLGTKAFYVRDGHLKGLDVMLGVHVGSEFQTEFAQSARNSGLVSVQYTFKGAAAHAAGGPWKGKSALDAIELMNIGWNFKREHLRTQQRSHYVVVNGGDQPNVVPSEATSWYFFRELDYRHIKDMFETGDTMAKGAAMMTGTTFSRRVVGSAWPTHFSKPIAEAQHKNIEMVGMPEWSTADQTLAKALQKEIGSEKQEGLTVKVKPIEAPKDPQGGGSDDVGDISWNLPMVYMRYPANIPELPGHSWENAIAMATPIAHKGSLAGAKAQALTTLDVLMTPALVEEAWKYFRDVQTKAQKYEAFIGGEDKPFVELNRDKMEKFLPQMKKLYYDPSKYPTYLDQLGIKYPTVR